jgi:hypothetical protein
MTRAVQLDELRRRGDKPADDAILYWQQKNPAPNCLHSLADQLLGFDFSPRADALIKILEGIDPGAAEALDPRRRKGGYVCSAADLAAGKDIFEKHGLKILLILICYSLPAAFAAQNGVRVLHSDNGSTGYFVRDPSRRLIETAQFIIEVFSPDGLRIDAEKSCKEQGPAIKSALRVRLLHATVRALIESNGSRGGTEWNSEKFGRPANQEDLTGTLMTFSWVVLDGLRKLHVNLKQDAQQSFYEIWTGIGKVLGVQNIPTNLDEASRVTDEIRKSQIYAPISAGIPNEFGIKMTKNVIEFMHGVLPWYLRWLPLPEALMRFFLPRDYDLAGSLGIRETPILLPIVRFCFWVESTLRDSPLFNQLNRMIFVEWKQQDPRAIVLLQFSRHMGRRILGGLQRFDRNAPIPIPTVEARRPHFDLHGWDTGWGLQQANPVTRLWRRGHNFYQNRGKDAKPPAAS